MIDPKEDGRVPFLAMMCDPRDFTITYVTKMTRDDRAHLEQFLPCDFANLTGKSIDIFHEHPEKIRRLLRNPENLPHWAKIALGDLAILQRVTAVGDGRGGYCGLMVTWTFDTEADHDTGNDVIQSIAAAQSPNRARRDNGRPN